MGYKEVCMHCRKAWNRPFTTQAREVLCPDCGQSTIRLTHRFRPPKKEDKQGWAVVDFLIKNGFHYQHIYDSERLTDNLRSYNYTVKKLVKYPKNLKEAKLFVEKYKAQAVKKKQSS